MTGADSEDSTPASALHAGAPAGSANPPYRHVLIVEDEAALRHIIARNLVHRGLVVREADSAEAAVSAIAAEQPDLMLLDINLPDRTGWEVLRELGRRKCEVPTIVMSAVQARPARIAEFHPVAYLPKPFPLESLLRLVCETAPAQLVDETQMEPV